MYASNRTSPDKLRQPDTVGMAMMHAWLPCLPALFPLAIRLANRQSTQSSHPSAPLDYLAATGKLGTFGAGCAGWVDSIVGWLDIPVDEALPVHGLKGYQQAQRHMLHHHKCHAICTVRLTVCCLGVQLPYQCTSSGCRLLCTMLCAQTGTAQQLEDLYHTLLAGDALCTAFSMLLRCPLPSCIPSS